MIDKITKIINKWDPVGLFPVAPKDEYCCEAEKIYRFISSDSGVDVGSLAAKINEIFTEAFGADVYHGDMEQCMLIAGEILRNKK